MTMNTRLPSFTTQATRERRTVHREPAGPAIEYRGYLLIPMIETIGVAGGGPGNRPQRRTRWDVIEQVRVEGRPDIRNRVKTCASQITAEGWVDAFGEPTGAAPAPATV